MTREEDSKLYNIDEIYKILNEKVSKEKLTNHFEQGTITGIKIKNQWHAKKSAIDDLKEYIATQNIKMIDRHTIDLRNITMDGRILDVGGGGEGVIGQLKGKSVVAIDRRKAEFESGMKAGDTESLKILMDASDLKFMNNSFDIVSAFFSFMYMNLEDLKKVFGEIFRVLKVDGELIIWDLNIPSRDKDAKDFIGIYLDVVIGEKIINTGYGTHWVRERNLKDYLDLAASTGFKIEDQKTDGNTFLIRCRKK